MFNISSRIQFLEFSFTPKNTPPMLRNSKMGLKIIFLGTPCRFGMVLQYGAPKINVRGSKAEHMNTPPPLLPVQCSVKGKRRNHRVSWG